MEFISHRGIDDHCFLENTKDAIEQSLMKNYIAGVEFDIRMTKDKKFILYHNMLIEDNGIFYLIKNKTLKELKKINNDLSMLDDVLKSIKNKKILVIEIKEESNDFDDVIINLFNVIKKYKHLNIYICSFNYKLMIKIKSKYPKYKCGLIIGYLMNINKKIDNFDFCLYSYNYIDFIDKKKDIFIFNINNKDKLLFIKNKIIEPYYIISDKSYKLINNY